MLELRLSGVHDDGEHLILESADGSQFCLPIDQNLRTSIAKARRIQPARGLSASETFGPRDIQTRFRQGATVEEIATESGWDAERVRRYEWPIIAERANIIAVARQVLISQPASNRYSETARSLDDHINQVAERFGFSDIAGEWGTYQQESGQWTISLDFDFSAEIKNSLPPGVLFPARWSYNPANQSIYASNEAAYFLMGRDNFSDAPLPGIGSHESIENTYDETAAPAAGSLASAESDSQKSGQNTPGKETGESDSAHERKLTDLLERARRKSTLPSLATHAEDLPAGNKQEEVSQSNSSTEQADGRSQSKKHDGAEQNTEEVSPSRVTQRTKRTSVPSWDDIIFGNQRK